MISSSPDPVDELAGLIEAFRRTAGAVPGLEVGGRGTVTSGGRPTDAERGILVTYRPEGCAGEALLWVSARRAKLRVLLEGEDGTRSELEDRLLLSLSRRPSLGRALFDSLDELAGALVEHMSRRLEALAIDQTLLADGPDRGQSSGSAGASAAAGP
jgi:hypothetical protein